MDTRFHCVYLLTSLDPQCDGAFYIGYTVNPLRRLRQHNGELVNGARRTGRRGRPWTLVCCVSGFTEDRVALKFEWCWQNPSASARLKHTAGGLGGLRRLPYAVATLHLLVRAPLFCQLDLTLHIFEPDLLHEAAARAELFLARQRSLQATGGGGGRSDAAPPSSPEPREATHLPPLTPSLLFHICTTTREAFEDAYLSHDRCLLLPSAGPAWGSTAAPAAEAEASRLDTSVDASCPYDVSLLSQAVQAELSLASFASESPERDGASYWNGVRRPGCDWRSAASRTPSPQRARVEEPVRLLGELSEERVAAGSRSGSGSRSPAVSAPRAVVPSASSASPSPSPQRSLPCTPPPPPPPRIPSRFAAYDSSDFARAHAAEQHRLRLGLLPCSLCALPLQPPCIAHCSRAPFCTLRCHLSCLAMWMLYGEAEAEGEGVTVPVGDVSTGVDLPSPASPVPMPAHRRLIPSLPCPCPLCSVPLHWATIVTELKRRVAVERRVGAAQRRRRVEQRWQTRLARMIESKRGASAVATRRRHQRQQRTDAAAVVGDGALRRGSTQDADHTPSTTPTAAAVVVGGASTDAPVPPPPVRNTSATSLVQVPASPPRTAAYALGNSRGTGVGAAAAATESTLLSLTNFCEEDWWLA